MLASKAFGLRPLALLLALALVGAALWAWHADEMRDRVRRFGPPQLVSPSRSSNIDEEVLRIRDALRLAPGKAYGEVGGGDGLFLSRLGPSVMPGGAVFGTGKNQAEVFMMGRAAAPELNASFAVGQALASGLPAACCDAILLRKVYHLLHHPEAYLQDLRRALKTGGRLLIIDHDSDIRGLTSRVGATLTIMLPPVEMDVVPPAALLAEAATAGFDVVSDGFPSGAVEPWPYLSEHWPDGRVRDERGYAVLLAKPKPVDPEEL